MKLSDLLRGVEPLSVTGTCDGNVEGVVCDSRQVRPGSVFVAIPGYRQDGWGFVADALDRGALAIVSEHEAASTRKTCHVHVADARRALALMACEFFGRPSERLSLAGITGTNGKTTVTYMIRDILQDAGLPCGLLTTVEYVVGERVIPSKHTTPEAPTLQSLLAQMVRSSCRAAVMEVSSHALVQKRAYGIDFDVGVFTNLTRDHLDFHKTLESYFEAKSLLFRNLGQGRKAATAVINADDPWGRRLLAIPDLKAKCISYGLSGDAAVRAEGVKLGSDGTTFVVNTPWGSREVRTRLLGRFNVSNALAAVAACGALGVSLEAVSGALMRFVRVPGRLEEIPTGRGFLVFVDYAHTDDALQNVLVTLREITAGRILVVFGCGGDRDVSKRPVMGQVASMFADYTILTSDNPRREDPAEIIRQIRAGFGNGTNCELIEDRALAIRRALELARPGDVVLVAGKGHETFQEFSNTTVPFDDRQVVRDWVQA